jgi:uncharacterized protein YqeY
MRDQINAALKDAMKSQDATRTATLRLMLAAMKECEIAMRDTDGDAELGDAACMQILSKMIKQREESANIYEEGGRLELAERERAEIDVIRDFLPQPLSAEETEDAVKEVIAEMKATSIKDMGKVMGALKERHTGRMDFSKVGAMVKSELA